MNAKEKVEFRFGIELAIEKLKRFQSAGWLSSHDITIRCLERLLKKLK
jgi:hypothetical protein